MDENRSIGKLYIVATPIGNSKDMSPRGRQILADADMIAAEDTRRSMVLLNKLEIRNKLVSNHKFNEYGKAKYFINELLSGKNVAVISDAGTPASLTPVMSLSRPRSRPVSRSLACQAAALPSRRCLSRALICRASCSMASFLARMWSAAACSKRCAAAIRAPTRSMSRPSALWSWSISLSTAEHTAVCACATTLRSCMK